MTLPTLLQSFDSFLRRRGRAVSTRRQYAYSLRSFCDWLGAQPVGDLMPADLKLFLIHWEAKFQARHGHLPNAATVRGTIGVLRVFFAYLERADLLVAADGVWILRYTGVRVAEAQALTVADLDLTTETVRYR